MFTEPDRLRSCTKLGETWLRDCVPGPASLGTFVRAAERRGESGGEWVASVTHHMDVVVIDAEGAPSPLGMAKALAIVQSCHYLERRAVQLLVPLTKEPGNWRLITLDFGAQARSQECEFLMCFAFEPSDSKVSITSPYAEVGFALMAPGVPRSALHLDRQDRGRVSQMMGKT